jgi:hypothetical protein
MRSLYVPRVTLGRPGLDLRVLALPLLAALLALTACGGSSAPSAATLLTNAKTTFDGDTSFHFVMTVLHPAPGSITSPSINGAQGDVQRPNTLKAVATADAGLATVNVTLILAGGKGWISDPVSGTYIATTQYNSFLNVFDAQQGIGSLLPKLQHPSAPTDGDANGASCWKIDGAVSPSDVGNLFGQVAATQAIPTSVCIGKSDNQLDSVTLNGVIVSGDTAQTQRTFYLSNFNQPVTIATPAPGA